MAIYQGGNSPIYLDFDEEVRAQKISVAIFDGSGKQLKHWDTEDVTIEGAKVTVQLTQQDTADFPAGKVTLEVKWLDNDGIIQISEPVELKVEKRMDRVIIL